MKAYEDMTSEELIALAKQKDQEAADANQKVEDSLAIVETLKAQVIAKKDLKAPVTTVKHEGETYRFPSETLTLPDKTGTERKLIEASKVSKDAAIIAELVERGVLIKVEAANEDTNTTKKKK